MSLQNRVDPWGEIVATPERGTLMGNRGGKFHRADKTLGKRRWASRHWIACELSYRGLHHEPMGDGYTSLFFLDEVTALAAGHRPCFFCRRVEAKRFLGGRKVDEFDRVLHGERLASSSRRKPAPTEQRESVSHDGLDSDMDPGSRRGDDLEDGIMVEIDGSAYAVKGQHLLRWSFAGYTERIPRRRGRLLTPPSILRILANGYQPRWHESALKGDGT